MFGLGTTEIVVILLIVLIVFGGSRLPQLGRGLGEAMRNFRDSFKDGGRDDAGKGAVDKPRDDSETKR